MIEMKITEILKAGQEKIAIADAIYGTFLFLTTLASGFALFVILNSVVFFSKAATSIYFFLWIALSVASLVFFVIMPLVRRTSLRKVAIRFEKVFPHLENRLISAWDLISMDTGSLGYSQGLINRVVEEAEAQLPSLDPKKLVSLQKTGQGFIRFLLSLLVIFLIFFISPLSFHNGVLRLFHPFESITRPLATTAVVSPGDTTITKFSNLTIQVKTFGKLPRRVSLFRKIESGKLIEFAFRRTDEGRFRYRFEHIKTPFIYFVEANDYISPVYTVSVVDRPRVIDIKLTLQPPGYTGFPRETIDENDGNIDCIKGTYVRLEILTSKNIMDGWLVFDRGDSLPMKASGRTADASFRVMRSGSYFIRVVDEDGNHNEEPIVYYIHTSTDEFPLVSIEKPGVDVDISEDMLLPMTIRGTDDFGFSAFYLFWSIKGDTSRQMLPFNLFSEKEVVFDYAWKLATLGLLPNDVATYWVVAYDNDNVSGPKMAESKHFSVRFPSLEEIAENLVKEQEGIEKTVQDVSSSEEDMIKKMQNLTKELQEAQEKTPWEKKEELQAVLKKQKEAIEKLEDISRKISETSEKIEKNRLATLSILEKMAEIRQILEDIATPEMREAMQKLQEALDNMSPEMLREAMKKFQMAQEEMLQKLDRTLSLLKRIQIEQRLKNLTELASRLAEQQKEINEKLASSSLSERQKLKREEEKLEQEFERVKSEMDNLADMMSEFPDMPSEELRKLSENLNAENLSGQMQEMASQIPDSPKGARKKGTDIQKALAKLAENLKGLQDMMQSMMLAALDADMREAILSLLLLSNRQEQVYTQLVALPRQDEKLEQLAREEGKLNEILKRTTDKIMEISGKTIFLTSGVAKSLGLAIERVESTAKEIAMNRNPRGGAKNSMEALAYINQAIELLMRSREKMASSSSATGAEQFFQQMQSLCNKQQGLNQNMMMLFGPKGAQGQLTMEQQAALQRLAAEQRAIKEALEELEKQYGQRKNLLGDLGEIAREMQESIERMKSENVDQKLIEKQEHILSRMLDAQRSIHKRDYTEKREARTGEDVVRRSPPEVSPTEQENRVRTEMMKALSSKYPREYEESIKAYFKALLKSQGK